MKLLLADRALQYADVRIRNSFKKCFHCHRVILPQTAAVRYSDSSDIKGYAADQCVHIERFGNYHALLPSGLACTQEYPRSSALAGVQSL